MKRLILTCAAALAVIPLAASPAFAAKPNIYHTIASTHASAVVSRADGCSLTEVFVSSSLGMYAAQPGPVNKQGLTGVLVQVTDICGEQGEVQAAAGGGTVLYRAEGQSPTPLVADPRIASASISDVLRGTDSTGEPVTIHLAATWTGVGLLEHSTVQNNSQYPEGNVAAHDNNLRRAATADVSVIVERDGDDVLAVSGTDDGASLEKIRSMCIEVPLPGVTEFLPCFGFPG